MRWSKQLFSCPFKKSLRAERKKRGFKKDGTRIPLPAAHPPWAEYCRETLSYIGGSESRVMGPIFPSEFWQSSVSQFCPTKAKEGPFATRGKKPPPTFPSLQEHSGWHSRTDVRVSLSSPRREEGKN